MDVRIVGLNVSRPLRKAIKRTKTGCGTCKARRVKCDEEWPACRRCTSVGRECTGYGVWGGGSGHPGRNEPCIRLCRPSNTSSLRYLTSEDHQIFDWFMLANIQGVFPFPFWQSLVPQACYSEPVILNCVLALGAIHKRACLDRGPTNSDIEVSKLESVALRHYNAAIKLLYGKQSACLRIDENTAMSTRVTLIACLMFIIIEYLQNRQAQGLLHLRCGMQIMRDHGLTNMQRSSYDPVDDWLAEAFDRLDMQAKLLFGTTTDKYPYPALQTSREWPLNLRSLHEARQQLDLLVSGAYWLQRQGRIVESPPNNITLLFRTLSIQQRLQRDLSSWLQAYRDWQTRLPTSIIQLPLSLEEQLARHLLSIYHIMASIMTATALYPRNEMAFDHYTLQFASIIDLSKAALQVFDPVVSGRVSAHGHCSQRFNFIGDLGIYPALYYTALKSRHSRIRRDALSLLTAATHQEGVWDGPTAALVAAEVIRLEETACSKPGVIYHQESTNKRPHSFVASLPSSQLGRISDVQIEAVHGPEIELVLVCRQKLGDGTWAVVKRTHDGLKWH